MRILGIETSCDETAAAVVEIDEKSVRQLADNRSQKSGFRILSNIVASQVKIHAKTGGVVPEVAARAHAENIISVIEKSVVRSQKSGIKNLKPNVDAIAVTTGPGLVTSLLVGVEAARTLAYIWKKPLVAVNHLEGHIYANFLPQEKIREFPISNFQFPILCLIVSGGHTELVLMRKHLDYQVIGATRDDAAGECFDKVAKILGLGYPGGPIVAKLAEQYYHPLCHSDPPAGGEESYALLKAWREIPRLPRLGGVARDDSRSILLPRPMIDSPDLDFSFAGLKTAVLYFVKDLLKEKRCGGFHAAARNLPQTILEKICASAEEAIVDVLVAKTIAAAKKHKVKTVMLGGGVAANQRLRERLTEEVTLQLPTIHCSLPILQYTGDNAAMIAAAGYFHARKKDFTPWQKLGVDPNWQLGKRMRKLW